MSFDHFVVCPFQYIFHWSPTNRHHTARVTESTLKWTIKKSLLCYCTFVQQCLLSACVLILNCNLHGMCCTPKTTVFILAIIITFHNQRLLYWAIHTQTNTHHENNFGSTDNQLSCTTKINLAPYTSLLNSTILHGSDDGGNTCT